MLLYHKKLVFVVTDDMFGTTSTGKKKYIYIYNFSRFNFETFFFMKKSLTFKSRIAVQY